ncbi:MAG: hypothetical protein KAJ07_03910 [Planctomycetes bacterium]|nr:hypothetical protein [Planctomycetota bacterium]
MVKPTPKRTPEDLGKMLSEQLKNIIKQIESDVKSFQATISKEQDERIKFMCNLDGIDTEVIVRELIIMAYASKRLALQLLRNPDGGTDIDNRDEICKAFNCCTFEYLDNSTEFNDLIDKRGGLYFQLLQSHLDEIHKEDWKPFYQGLTFHFSQFCLGRGVGKKAPVIIGEFGNHVPLGMLANKYWDEGFVKTGEFLVEQEVY